MTFKMFCEIHNVNEKERERLLVFLACFRALATMKLQLTRKKGILMQFRIRGLSRGTKGKDWERFYRVEGKSFLFWVKLRDFDMPDAAADFVNSMGKYTEVIF